MKGTLPGPSGLGAFGDHVLLEEIARGGMGVVYRAQQVSLNRVVALKRILAEQVSAPDEVLRFQLEAKSAAGLDHPNIVPLYEIGEHQGSPYFTMKFVEGGNLATHMPYLATDPFVAARLIQTVAQAVHYAHTRGVLHRDLKPANILIDRDGQPYVSDFGLAKKIEDDSSLTRSGTVLGTPSYMSPEQAAGKKGSATTASDVYSLGAILYELMTGQPPFRADSFVKTLHQVIHDEPIRPSQLQPKVPRDLETICLKCLEKEPGRRYPSAEDLAEELGRFLEGETILARPAGTWERTLKWTRRRPATAALVGVSFAAVMIFLFMSLWYNMELGSRAREYKAQELLARRYVYTTRMNIAFDAWKTGNLNQVFELLKSLIPRPPQEDLRGFDWYHLWRLSNRDTFTLRGHTDIVNRVAFSPDSRTLATGSYDQDVKLWDTATGKEIAALEGPSGHVDALAFSPDGGTLFTAYGDRLILWDLTARRVRLALDGHGGTINCVALSPDGELLATACGDGAVRLWDPVEGRELGTLVGHAGTLHGVAFSPDGKSLASASQDSILKLWDTADREEKLSADLHAGPLLSVAFSPDSRTAVMGAWDGSVRLWDLSAGKEKSYLSCHKGPVCQIALHPILSTIATAGSDHLAKLLNPVNGIVQVTLRGHAGGLNAVAFSPDGRWLATGASDRTAKLWDGQIQSEPGELSGLPDTVAMIALPRDGRTLVTGSADLTLMLTDLGQPGSMHGLTTRARIKLEGKGVTSWALSCDGKTLAATGPDSSIEMWSLLWDRESAAETCLEGHAAPVGALALSLDARTLVSAGRDGKLIVWDRTLSTRGKSWLERGAFDIEAEDVSDLALSPDGKTLAMAREEDPAVIVWDLQGGRRRGELKGHWRRITALAFSPDSRLLATGSLDLMAKLWKVGSLGKEGSVLKFTLHGHMNAVASLAFSPDGKVLATGSDDHSVKLWDLTTGEERETLEDHEGEVEKILFSSDGRSLITAGGKRGAGEVRVWHAASDEEVARRLEEE